METTTATATKTTGKTTKADHGYRVADDLNTYEIIMVLGRNVGVDHILVDEYGIAEGVVHMSGSIVAGARMLWIIDDAGTLHETRFTGNRAFRVAGRVIA